MSNGNEDFQHLSNVSLTLLEAMRSRGRLPMPSLSGFAREAMTRHLTGHTECLSQHYQNQSQLSENEQRLAQRRAKILSTYSDEDLARMDAAGIKILGVFCDFDIL